MKKKQELNSAESEFEKFDETMEKLLAVPYSELQKKLEDEKRRKRKANTVKGKQTKNQPRP